MVTTFIGSKFRLVYFRYYQSIYCLAVSISVSHAENISEFSVHTDDPENSSYKDVKIIRRTTGLTLLFSHSLEDTGKLLTHCRTGMWTRPCSQKCFAGSIGKRNGWFQVSVSCLFSKKHLTRPFIKLAFYFSFVVLIKLSSPRTLNRC